MARTLDTVVTTGGQTWQKKQDSAGRTYHVENGEGRVSQQQFAAAKSHSGPAEAFSRGNFEPDTLGDLGPPFDADRTEPVNQYERGTEERKEAAEVNRWLGYKHDRNTSDDPLEAAEEYYEFKQDIQEADTPEQKRDVKERYNIGGS